MATNKENLYKSESNRKREEKFLRTITDNYNNRLLFTTRTCTDGNVVQVFPDHPFIQNVYAVETTVADLKVGDYFKDNEWLLTKTFARGGISHEAFHILFTDFTTLEKMEKEFRDKHSYKTQVMHDIFNIIEDSYIELAGINYLEGLEFYIQFSNHIAYYNVVSLEEKEKQCEEKKQQWINLFLHWAMMYAIMGKVKGEIKNKRILEKIKKTKKYFNLGRVEKDCNKRYFYAKKVFDIVEDLVDEAIKDSDMFDFNYFKNHILPKLKEKIDIDVDLKKDFSGREGEGNLIVILEGKNKKGKNKNDAEKVDGSGSNDKVDNNNDEGSSGKDNNDTSNSTTGNDNGSDQVIDDKVENHEGEISQREEEIEGKGNPVSEVDPKEEELKRQERIKELLEELNAEKDKVEKEEQKREREEMKDAKAIDVENRILEKVRYSNVNKGIKIDVNRKFTNSPLLEQAYNKIYENYKPIIKSFVKKFAQLIQDQEESWTDKLMIGSTLNTRRMADPKQRVWQRKNEQKEVAELCIQILIDGSGSMKNKLTNVTIATIILYEVAKELNIPISIVEERAVYSHPLVIHNVLVDYRNYKKENTKYNIMNLTAGGGTREGVSLKWAAEYQNLQPQKDKLLIVLADGNPEHSYSYQSYTGSLSASDTKEVAKSIEKKGTNIVAISLGQNCYNALSQIYNHTIMCDDLSKLSSQLIRVLKKNLFKK